ATPPPLKRLETVQTLAEHGIHAGIFAAPLLPYLTDSYEDLDKLFSSAQQHGARFISASVLRLVPDVKTWFFHVLEQHYPHLLPVYRQLYRAAYPTTRYAQELKKKLADLYTQYEVPDDVPSAAELRTELSEEPDSHQGVEQLSFVF
ncbi:MAG: radical protein, partial [Bacilli bacterium]|nr:radical protein [Bacilli bacterium]